MRAWLTHCQSGEILWIAGTGSGSYFREFMQLVRQSQGHIRYVGELKKEAVAKQISDCHYLVLPSGLEGGAEQENFGNVVAEALSVGRPVLITGGLAWDHLEVLEAGLTFSKDSNSIRTTIERGRALVRDGHHHKMCERARVYAEQHLDICDSAQAMYDLCKASIRIARPKAAS